MTTSHSVAAPVPVVVHLSGSRRGTTERLAGDVLTIGTSPAAAIRLAADEEPAVGELHARLERRGPTYELSTAPGQSVWVNGEPVKQLVLASGDVLEVGEGGPILRFRLYPPGSRAYKSVVEAFADCIDCARRDSGTSLQRASILLTSIPRELATQTQPWIRGSLLALLLLLLVASATLVHRGLRLEERLTSEELRVAGLAELLEHTERRALSRADLAVARSELEGRLSATVERVAALEARSDAAGRTIANASRSIVFLQGAYGFVETATGRSLRYAGLGPDGIPLTDDAGNPLVGPDGRGPEIEALFTGTAFVATKDGLLLTNRHVASPWEYDDAAGAVMTQGFQPVMSRFVGYLPGVEEPFDVSLLLASDVADVAVLKCGDITGEVPSLELALPPPSAGDEVLVMGYPTGIRALLARADEGLVTQLMSEQGIDFWSVARKLSAASQIGPLASQGIVGQVTSAAIVYDAETTSGGSGGPVLDLDGRVVAVNVAIMPEFGGSNMGVPAAYAQQLLARAAASQSVSSGE
ncbi:MAG: trypsin-like peptidase domain-containing protein [Thermoanaerobaculia bacterium]